MREVILVVVGVVSALAIGGVIGATGYTLGVKHERIRHFEWLGEGWMLCVQHFDWLRLTAKPEEEWAQIHMMYMTDVFGPERPYPLVKEKEGKEK